MSEPELAPVPGVSASRPADRRTYVRLASDLAAMCRTTRRFHEVGWPGTVRDVSLSGVGLLVRHRFRPGTALHVELRENTGKLLRTVEVHVIHATAVLVEGSPRWLLGCTLDQPLTDEEFRSLL
jgi:hypothetical protein